MRYRLPRTDSFPSCRWHSTSDDAYNLSLCSFSCSLSSLFSASKPLGVANSPKLVAKEVLFVFHYSFWSTFVPQIVRPIDKQLLNVVCTLKICSNNCRDFLNPVSNDIQWWIWASITSHRPQEMAVPLYGYKYKIECELSTDARSTNLG